MSKRNAAAVIWEVTVRKMAQKLLQSFQHNSEKDSSPALMFQNCHNTNLGSDNFPFDFFCKYNSLDAVKSNTWLVLS